MPTTITKLAQSAGLALHQQRLKLATAESCTGGGLGYWITMIAGSSAWFEGGFITYSNEAKITMLGVSPHTLKQHGAVSSEIACEMAEGALKHTQADIGIAITGIAGPTGGSKEKPIGTVFIASAKRGEPTKAMHHIFNGNRDAVRLQAIMSALQKLLDILRRPSS